MSARPHIGATRPARESGASRYGRPVIKEPVWKPEIPFYLYTGGLAGASAGLALVCDARGEHGVARRAWVTAFAGSIASPALLISDLGVPARFLNMLRVFKVTSPMSVGSWILAAFGAATAPATVHAVTGGGLGSLGRAAQASSAVLGMPLATYTAALIANTSIPVWHEARHELAFVFAAGAAASAGAAAVALAPVQEAGVARRLAIGGAVLEVAVTEAMERRLDRAGVGAPYDEGTAARLSKAALGLTTAGAGLLAWRGRRSRAAAVGAAAMLTGGAVLERWAIFRAGFQSAARPQDTVDPQRARIASGAAGGAARSRARVPAPARTGEGHRPGERPVLPGSPAVGARPEAKGS